MHQIKKRTCAPSRVAGILQALAEKHHTLTQLCDRLDVHPEQIKTTVAAMVDDGRIRVLGFGDNGHGRQGRKPFLYALPA